MVWAIVALVYLRYEAYPTFFTRTLPGYRGLLPEDLLTRESWSRILIDGQPAGYVHTVFTVDDDQPEPVLEITTRMQMRVRVLQSTQRIHVLSEILLDQDYLPKAFTLSTSTGDFSLRVTGEHMGNREFAVTTHTGSSTHTRTVVLPQDAVLYSPLHDLAIQQLRPGRSLAIRTLDPLTLQTATIMIAAGQRETIMLDDREIRVLPLEANWQGLVMRSWLDENGLMVRQETPLGWMMETATAEDALQTVSESHPAPPILPGMAGLSLLQTLIGAPAAP